jgi:hypothetical protein
LEADLRRVSRRQGCMQAICSMPVSALHKRRANRLEERPLPQVAHCCTSTCISHTTGGPVASPSALICTGHESEFADCPQLPGALWFRSRRGSRTSLAARRRSFAQQRVAVASQVPSFFRYCTSVDASQIASSTLAAGFGWKVSPRFPFQAQAGRGEGKGTGSGALPAWTRQRGS